MVKLEFHANEKPATVTVPVSEPSSGTEKEETVTQQTPIMIGEVEFFNQPRHVTSNKTMDWMYIRRVSIVQMLLAFLAIICITIIVFTAEMNRLLMWSKTALFSWALFLLTTGYCGYRSSGKNYCQVVAYFIMSIFQTMINGFWLALLFLAACYVIAYRDNYFEGNDWSDLKEFKVSVDWNTGVLVCELIETLCLFATIFTGLLGAFAGCKGFGRILQYQDGAMSGQTVELSPRY